MLPIQDKSYKFQQSEPLELERSVTKQIADAFPDERSEGEAELKEKSTLSTEKTQTVAKNSLSLLKIQRIACCIGILASVALIVGAIIGAVQLGEYAKNHPDFHVNTRGNTYSMPDGGYEGAAIGLGVGGVFGGGLGLAGSITGACYTFSRREPETIRRLLDLKTIKEVPGDIDRLLWNIGCRDRKELLQAANDSNISPVDKGKLAKLFAIIKIYETIKRDAIVKCDAAYRAQMKTIDEDFRLQQQTIQGIFNQGQQMVYTNEASKVITSGHHVQGEEASASTENPDPGETPNAKNVDPNSKIRKLQEKFKEDSTNLKKVHQELVNGLNASYEATKEKNAETIENLFQTLFLQHFGNEDTGNGADPGGVVVG